MRLLCLAPGLLETLYDLGLGPQVAGRSAACRWPAEAADVPVVEDPAAADADVVVAAGPLPTLHPRQRAVSFQPARLDEAVDLILPLAEALGVPKRGVMLHRQRSARLLALRMHVARYLVRAGAARPTVVLDLGADWAPWIPDCVDAAGGLLTPGLAPPGDVPTADAAGDAAAGDATSGDGRAAGVEADVLIVGRFGVPVDAVGARPAARRPARAWAIDADAVLRYPGPRLVDGVETLLRIVIPEALGANGTPPGPALARPL